jgi:hypothetical protein
MAPAGRGAAASVRVWLARHANVVGLAGYLLLALILLGRTWFGGELSQRLVGRGGDPLGFVWFLDWLPHALVHGQSPFFTTLLMAPQGANLLNSTSIALPSLLLWPVTATLGATISLNVLATVGPALSAWAACFALRRITPYRSSAWVGGAIYGFGGYMAGQATAHVNLTIAVLPPIVAMLLDDVRRSRSPVRTGLLLGACAAAQVFVNEEVLALTAVIAALALLFAYWAWRPTRATVGRYLRALAAAAAAFAVLAGPAVLYQLLGPQHVHGVVVSSGRYVDDLASFFVPSSVQWLSAPGSRHLASTFSGFDGEGGAYLGIPLLALLIWALWRLRRRGLPAALLLACAALLSLGPHLRVLGHDTGIFLPWIVPNHLPLLEDAVPDRFNLFIWLAVAVLVVQLVDDLRRRPLLGRRSLGIAACGIALVPILPALTPSEVVRVPSVLANASAFHRVLPHAKSVLITPIGNGQFAMFAQARAGFVYRIPGGGVFVPGKDGPAYGMRHGPLLYALAALEGRVSTQAGRTPADAMCLEQIDRGLALSGGCRSHYLGALGALQVDAVIACDVGSAFGVRREDHFFTMLLGPPLKIRGAEVFAVGV